MRVKGVTQNISIKPKRRQFCQVGLAWPLTTNPAPRLELIALLDNRVMVDGA
jgi:hypothetical protein